MQQAVSGMQNAVASSARVAAKIMPQVLDKLNPPPPAAPPVIIIRQNDPSNGGAPSVQTVSGSSDAVTVINNGDGGGGSNGDSNGGNHRVRSYSDSPASSPPLVLTAPSIQPGRPPLVLASSHP
jgi:hypothetical protein